MRDELGTSILKDVSRSFYLTLRLLPREMREAASLGYLLARTSDTIADTESVPAAERERLLEAYAASVALGTPPPSWPEAMLSGATAGEMKLLVRAQGVLDWLSRVDPREAALIREVVAIIAGGQLLDLGRFAGAGKRKPVALATADELEGYTFSVAGCVGAFWTKLGCFTMGERYSRGAQPDLLAKGIGYGKGLQLVNILRDLPRDLAAGRCYLPVADPADRDALMREFRVWHARAEAWVEQGLEYSATLRSRRLRAATVLPALLADETLALLKDITWEGLEARVKVPRHRVYLALAEAFLF